jgi:hypothetical protein
VAVIGVGAYWLIKNVNFKQTEEDKEDTKWVKQKPLSVLVVL